MAVKTVLVTGASRGIGRALAIAFGSAGYCVGVNYVQEKEKAEAVVHEIAAGGVAQAAAFQGDVRDSLKVRQIVDAVVTRWGRLDVLVNNAGITRDRTLLKMTNGEWNDVIDVNLSGVFWCLREAGRAMCDQKSGSIINIASRVAYRPIIGAGNYSAAKAGVIALTQTAALEFGRFNVRVNAVLPGFHQTDMGNRLPEKERDRVLSEHLLPRTTQTPDLTRFVVSLAQNESVSGQVFNVDNRLI